MFLRKALGLLRRRRFHGEAAIATTHRRTTNTTNASFIPLSCTTRFSCQYGSGVSTGSNHHKSIGLWMILYGQAAIILGLNGNLTFADDVSVESGSGNNTGEASLPGLHRVEDGSVISNTHTSKWRIFTDNGRDLFLQGKLEEAENYFLLALQEAKEGFGERDPHVASACNNLAELYRVKRDFDKAEPLYLEAIHILEESFGPEDVRVAAALHNLGQFYLVQRKLEKARICYERALKIKGRVLGHGHTDYADTMYHLGVVIYLQGMENDAVALIQDSIRILEEAGLGESVICVRRLRHLAQIFLKSNRLTKAENIQRKILHIMELSKGWNSLDTIIAAESLALTLQSIGNLKEAQELLERCLDVRETILPKDHIQIGANMLHLARIAMLKSSRLRKVDISEAHAELDKAKILLDNAIRISRQVLNSSDKKRSNLQKNGDPKMIGKDEHEALVILLQSLDALGLLEVTKQEFVEPRDDCQPLVEAEHAYHQCITAFKEVAQSENLRAISNSHEVKTGYLTCLRAILNLRHLLGLISETRTTDKTQASRKSTLQELKEEIKRVEAELLPQRRRRN